MSDLMLLGVLRMPYDLAMGDELSRRQFHERGRQAADEIERLRARVTSLELAEEGAAEAFGVVVQDKRDLEAECKRLDGLLASAYDHIRRLSKAQSTHNGGTDA